MCARARGEADYGNTAEAARIEKQRVSEPEIQRNEAASFPLAGLDHRLVGRRGQTLLEHRGHIVPLRPQDLGGAVAEVLVELQLHCVEPTRRSRYRSRDISAP